MKTKAEIAAYRQQWVANNRERSNAIKRQWAKKNDASERERKAAWKRANPAKVVAEAMKRQAQKLNATPPWADMAAIEAVYVSARVMEQSYGGKWEVDHVIPLRSPLVCGLHIANNLRCSPARENRLKGNRFDPELERMPVGRAF